MDKLKLIAEIRDRPFLWKTQPQPRGKIERLWAEVSQTLGADVKRCRAEWAKLRGSYRKAVRRTKESRKRDRCNGIYYPKKHYGSKSILIKHMNFLRTANEPLTENYELKTDDFNQSFSNYATDANLVTQQRRTFVDSATYNRLDYVNKCEEVPRLKNPASLTAHYYFLISLLPQMEKLPELQNLQFRAKMCDMALDILAPTIERNVGNNSATEPIKES